MSVIKLDQSIQFSFADVQENSKIPTLSKEEISRITQLKTQRQTLFQFNKLPQTTKNVDINPLKESGTVSWLKKRFKKKASLNYMNTPSQLKRLLALEMLFNNFDDDKSGTLEVCEMNEMFQQFGFDISQNDMKKLFSMINAEQAGKMDLEEFKEFMLNEKVANEFRKIMKNLRKNERGKLEEDKMIYIPMNFNSMLNYIYHQIQHQELTGQLIGVEKSISNKNNLRSDMEQFLKIFEFDRVPNEENFAQNNKNHNKSIQDSFLNSKTLEKQSLDGNKSQLSTLNEDQTAQNDRISIQNESSQHKTLESIKSPADRENEPAIETKKMRRYLDRFEQNYANNTLTPQFISQIKVEVRSKRNQEGFKTSFLSQQRSSFQNQSQRKISQGRFSQDSEEKIKDRSNVITKLVEDDLKPIWKPGKFKENRAFKNLKFFIEEMHGKVGSPKNTDLKKQKVQKYKLKPYLEQSELDRLRQEADSMCKDQANNDKMKLILTNQTFTNIPKFQLRSNSQDVLHDTFSSINTQKFQSQLTRYQPVKNWHNTNPNNTQKEISNRQKDKDTISPTKMQTTRQILEGANQTMRLLSFKDAMSLPAFDLNNHMKMRLIKNSMDINIKDLPDLQKLNLFKVAKSLSSKYQSNYYSTQQVSQYAQKVTPFDEAPDYDIENKILNILSPMSKFTSRKSSVQNIQSNSKFGRLPVNMYTKKTALEIIDLSPKKEVKMPSISSRSNVDLKVEVETKRILLNEKFWTLGTKSKQSTL
ncbi:ef hand family protein [Stylonychia lemnae]|uniref:Ef hand family protein n=1 Tax=Stylonychia lemnae TaxID=5949 RepID=A0A077ZNU7_STYLE|nr:ef hand family protein [Stylonychia lemnae]|eukprot:CDW71144.1 ef hand family protein [Stylonychia lemnae]